ncbi:MAG: c-type cytochrome [Caldilineaceae bacterium]|nr:c-type cytochrome [Caldilineaceae bacterium]
MMTLSLPRMRRVGAVLAAVFVLAACTRTSAPDVAGVDVAGEELAGGMATIFNTTPNAFGQPAPGLEREDELFFFVGNSFFNQNWVQAPASTTARDGLGPLFNSRSCAGCHFKDGRGRPPAFQGELPVGFLLRLSVPGHDLHHAPAPEPNYGLQLQEAAIDGVAAEGSVRIEYTPVAGAFVDGTPYELRRPSYTVDDLAYGPLDPEVMLSPRVANQMIGLGLLEAIDEADLLANADPTDRDGDGISGRPNQVWDIYNNRMALGRFGWKANQPHVLQQVASAFAGDMGITTGLLPQVACRPAQTDCLAAPDGGAPEIADDDLLKVVLYAGALAVPARRDWDDATVRRGQTLFHELGCASCHTPKFTTGIHPTIPALSHQTIYPYTDLLLHDMGEELADGRPDFLATGQEWRTPPLWGIGLVPTVNGHTRYLHDGRARTLMEAVLWHGGEAAPARDRVLTLPAEDRDALIRFLESL